MKFWKALNVFVISEFLKNGSWGDAFLFSFGGNGWFAYSLSFPMKSSHWAEVSFTYLFSQWRSYYCEAAILEIRRLPECEAGAAGASVEDVDGDNIEPFLLAESCSKGSLRIRVLNSGSNCISQLKKPRASANISQCHQPLMEDLRVKPKWMLGAVFQTFPTC